MYESKEDIIKLKLEIEELKNKNQYQYKVLILLIKHALILTSFPLHDGI